MEKQWKSADVSQMVYLSKGLAEMYVFLKSSDQIKSYGHLSMIFLFFNDLLPSIVMSRNTNNLF